MSNKILSLIYRSAVNSVLPEQLIRASICIHSQEGILDIVDKITNKHHYVEIADRDVFIFGAGKGVVGMCQEMLEQIDLFNSARNLPSVRVNFGQLNIPFDCKIEKPEIFQKYNIKYYECARNNIPDEHSVSNTIKMIDSLNKYLATTINPIVIGFITGGGSSLLSLPNSSVSIEDKQKLIKELVQKGANIVELNAIRSNFSQVKSGKLAKQILTWNNNCQLIVLIISDIINDPIEMIASGPTIISRDNPIFIKEIMNKYSIKLDKNLQKIYDKPKSDEYFEINCNKLKNIIIGNNSIALIAAKRQAEKEGFKVILFPFALCGEACLVVEKLVNSAIMYEVTHQDKANYKGVIWLAGGEATIKMDNVENIGKGGRCQEMGLLFIKQLFQKKINKKISALFAGTDGQDGPTDIAGVNVKWPVKFDKNNVDIVDEIDKAIYRHDSNNFWIKYASNCLIKTGITGTNVMDIYSVLLQF